VFHFVCTCVFLRARYLTTLASVIHKWMCTGYWCSDTDRGNRSTGRKICPSVTHHKSYLDCSGTEPRPALWKGRLPTARNVTLLEWFRKWHDCNADFVGVCMCVCTCTCACACTERDRRSTFRLLVPVFIYTERWGWMVAFPTLICERIRTCAKSRLTLFANSNQIVMSHKITCKAKILVNILDSI